MTIEYDQIFSRVFGKITANDLLSLDEETRTIMLKEWLVASVYQPRIRRLFSSFELDEDFNEITCELTNSVDEYSDMYFVIELITIGMVIEWLQPKVDSVLYTAPMIGGKEEKMLMDHHKDNINRLESLKVQQAKMIRDYGYMHNSYISGQ